MNEFVKNKFIEVIFVKTKDNTADIFTKNTSAEISEVHHQSLLAEIQNQQEGC